MIKIYIQNLDRDFMRVANNRLNDYLNVHFEPYDSLSDKKSILLSDDIFEEYVFDDIFPEHLYRLDKKKCIETALELREWIRDFSEHTLTPLHEYILHKVITILIDIDNDCDGELTGKSYSEENYQDEDEEEEKNLLNGGYNLDDLRDLHFYLEHCFEDYDFYYAEHFFRYAIDDPDFEKTTNTYLTEYKELVPWDVVKKYEEVKELRFLLKSMMKDKVTLVKQNGEIHKDLKAYVEQNKILILGVSIIIEEGDTLNRTLPNNHIEEYIVMETNYCGGKYGVPEHYKLGVRKSTSMNDFNIPGSTYYNIQDHSVTTINGGNNNRVNKYSTDNSSNLVYTKSEIPVFNDIREKLNTLQIDQTERDELLSQVDDLEATVDTPNFTSRYQKFISSAANHMTVLAPLLPALTELLK